MAEPNKKSSAEYTANYMEYIVDMKTNTSLVLKKAGIILLAVALVALAFIFLHNFLPLFPVLFILIAYLCWNLWHYVNIEFEYVIAGGEMDMDIIYGRKKRKKLFSVKIRDFEIIAPVCEEYKNKIEDVNIKKRIFAASSLNSPNTYFAVYTDSNNVKTLVYFEATKKTLDIMRFYNPRATVVSNHITH